MSTQDIANNLKNIFSKEIKIQTKIDKLEKKIEVLYNKKCKIAYSLYKEFLLKNIDTLHNETLYYYLHIENSNFCLAEELLYNKKYSNNLIEFRHNSIHRSNKIVSLYLDVKKSDYKNSSVIIDKVQFSELSKYFTIKIRE